jgi:hypothetical protein
LNHSKSDSAFLSREQLLTVPETEEERYDQLWSRY